MRCEALADTRARALALGFYYGAFKLARPPAKRTKVTAPHEEKKRSSFSCNLAVQEARIHFSASSEVLDLFELLVRQGDTGTHEGEPVLASDGLKMAQEAPRSRAEPGEPLAVGAAHQPLTCMHQFLRFGSVAPKHS